MEPRFDVVITSAVGNKGTSDAQQLLFAWRQRRVIVTYNREDFILIDETLRLWGREWGVSAPRHAGILIIPNPRVLSNAEAARQVSALASGVTSFDNRIFLWSSPAGWKELA